MSQVLPRDGLSARPLAFVVVFIVLGLALPQLARAEEPKTPYLTGTNPTSSLIAPALDTSPWILGEAEPTGVHSSVLGFGALPRGGLATMTTKHPEYEIW